MRSPIVLVIAVAVVALAPTGSGAQTRSRSQPASRTNGRVYYGFASWYGGAFHGRRTAYGERFDRSKMTLASRFLPYNTRCRVTFLRTGKSCIARVTDYGPNGRCRRRIADLSEGAAAAIGLRSAGVGPVRIEVLGREQRAPRSAQWAAGRSSSKAKPASSVPPAKSTGSTDAALKEPARPLKPEELPPVRETIATPRPMALGRAP